MEEKISNRETIERVSVCKMYKPNERIATVLQLEYNLGLRIGDILNLSMDNFMKDAGRYHLDIHEQKTGEYRNFIVPVEIYNFIRDYAYENNISPKAKLFPIIEPDYQDDIKNMQGIL